MTDRRTAPSAARNRDPILAVLRDVLPPTGLIVEVASGTGEHAAHFACALPALRWQPSDPSPEARASSAAWTADLPNVAPPLPLDAAAPTWPLDHADALLAINMVHISPWAATTGLFAHAGRLLPPGGPLVLYGPFVEAGHSLAPSNAAFDADLRARDPAWGLREVDALVAAAVPHSLALDRRVAMPANNLVLVFRRG